jgi:transglutaminase-like putative cysteine protease
VRFDIRYEAQYHYPEPVTDSLNTLRVKPAVTTLQTVEAFELLVDPDARVQQRRDYFGTDVLEFEVGDPHDRLEIVAHASVLTDPAPDPPTGSWEAVGQERYRRQAGEFLLQDPTEMPPEGGLDDLIDAVRADSPLQTALRVTEAIPDRFEYRPGTTFVGSTVSDLLAAGGGVCQDFVHLGLILLRSHGIGARYVSGYLWAADAEGGRDSVEVQTHAWAEALLPPESGEPRWVGFDPTNRGFAGETHVKIGHGRNYQDVPPIRGVYRGPAADELDVAVRMQRVNGDEG